MARWVLLFFLSVIYWGVSSRAQAASFATCDGGVPVTSASCPIMDMTGDTPEMMTVELPKPIGIIEVPKKVYFFSGPLCIVDYSIRTTMEGLYAVFSDAFINPFKVVLMLYVVVYAISFMFGLVNPRDFALRLFKIAVVWLLVSDNCTFYNYVYGGFIGVSNDLIKIIGEVNADTTSAPPPATASEAQQQLYQSLDNMFENVVGVDGLIGLGILLLSSLTSGGAGATTGMLVMLGFGSMALAMLRALVTLGVAMAAIAFFLLFAPMFLSFFLFQATRRLFDNWLSMLISFTLQPLIIFAFLGMMRVVLDSTVPTNANINHIIEDSVQMIHNQPFQPEMMQGRPTVNLYQPDPAAMAALGAAMDPPIEVNPCGVPPVEPCDSPLDIQQKFFDYFMPKLLFWFFVNMVMAGFIKEVPGFAHRLAGYISAPPLGATVDANVGRGRVNDGIMLPGISRGAGGETTSLLASALGKGKAARNMGIGAVGLATAAGLQEALRGKGRLRDASSDIENVAAVGEANREKAQISRTGTLAELLGMKTVGRDSAVAEGIGSGKTASREGPNVVGIGEKEGAVRRDTLQDNIRAQRERAEAEARALAEAHENAKRGQAILADLLPSIHLTAPKLPEVLEKPTVQRDINLRDVELVRQEGGTAVYRVNGQELKVSRAQEERFLMEKIAEISKDMTKTKTMGARGGVELKYSAQQREELEERLQTLLAEKRSMESAQQVKERMQIQGMSRAEIEKLEATLPAIVQQQNVSGMGQAINRLKASKHAKDYTQLILDMEELYNAMRAQGAARTETVDSILQKQQEAAQQQEEKPVQAQKPQNILKLQGRTQKAMTEVVARSRNAEITEELTKAAGQLPSLVQRRDLGGIQEMIDNLKTSRHAAEYGAIIAELEDLQQALQARSAVRKETVSETAQPSTKQNGTPPQQQASQRKDLAASQRDALRAMAEASRNIKDTEAKEELAGAAGDLPELVQRRDVAGISNMVSNLQNRPYAEEYEPVLREMSVLGRTVEETRRQEIRQLSRGAVAEKQAELLNQMDEEGLENLLARATEPKTEQTKLVEKEEQPEIALSKEEKSALQEASGGILDFGDVVPPAQSETTVAGTGGKAGDTVAGGESGPGQRVVKRTVREKNPDYNPDDPGSEEYVVREVTETITGSLS